MLKNGRGCWLHDLASDFPSSSSPIFIIYILLSTQTTYKSLPEVPVGGERFEFCYTDAQWASGEVIGTWVDGWNMVRQFESSFHSIWKVKWKSCVVTRSHKPSDWTLFELVVIQCSCEMLWTLVFDEQAVSWRNCSKCIQMPLLQLKTVLLCFDCRRLPSTKSRRGWAWRLEL